MRSGSTAITAYAAVAADILAAFFAPALNGLAPASLAPAIFAPGSLMPAPVFICAWAVAAMPPAPPALPPLRPSIAHRLNVFLVGSAQKVRTAVMLSAIVGLATVVGAGCFASDAFLCTHSERATFSLL